MALLCLCSAVFATAAGVGEGMSRAEVEAALGKPLAVLERNGVTILRYPNEGRVELAGGKVTRVVRVRHVSDPATPEEIAAEEAAQAARTAAEEEKKEAAAYAKAEAEYAKASAAAQRDLEAAVDRLGAEHDQGAAAFADDMGLGEEPAHFWIMQGAALLVQTIVGMVILKLAFKWADVHADWGQMWLPSLTGAAAGTLVRGLGYSVWQVTDFFRIDDAISYVALLTALMKLTHACTWQRAFAVAAAAKLMTIVVWTFLGVALAHALFA